MKENTQAKIKITPAWLVVNSLWVWLAYAGIEQSVRWAAILSKILFWILTIEIVVEYFNREYVPRLAGSGVPARREVPNSLGIVVDILIATLLVANSWYFYAILQVMEILFRLGTNYDFLPSLTQRTKRAIQYFKNNETEISHIPKFDIPSSKTNRKLSTHRKAKELTNSPDEFSFVDYIAHLRATIFPLPTYVSKEQERAAIVALEQLNLAVKAKNRNLIDQARKNFERTIQPILGASSQDSPPPPTSPRKMRPQIVSLLNKSALAIDDFKKSIKEYMVKIVARTSLKIDRVLDFTATSSPDVDWDSQEGFTTLNLNSSEKPDNKPLENNFSIPATPPITSPPLVAAPPPSPAIQQNSQQQASSFPKTILQPIGQTPVKVESTTRSAVGEVEVRQVHRQMQAELVRCLHDPRRTGRKIYTEVDGIDILVSDVAEDSLLEIKTGTDLVLVLREAIGQLLEYQYFARRRFIGRKTRLIAISPLPLDPRASEYLLHLKNAYHLEIEYRQYIPGSYTFSL